MTIRIQVVFLSLLSVLVVGCSTGTNRRRVVSVRADRSGVGAKSDGDIPPGCVKALPSEILSQIRPSFSVQNHGEPTVDQGRDCIVGTWQASYVSESKNGNLTKGYRHKGNTTLTYHRVDKYYEDGTYRVVLKCSGKETVMTGEWEYENGVFTAKTKDASGKKTRFSFRILWYGKDEFEMRISDLAAYERILKSSNLKSVRCRYEENGLFHTEMIIGAGNQESAVVTVQSPIVFERGSGE